MTSKGGPSVPKFGSFKGKPDPIPASEKDQIHQKPRHEEGGGSSGSNKNDRSHDRQKEASATTLVRLPERRESEDRIKPGRQYRVSQRSAPPPPRSNDELFVVDRGGDALIRRYGSNDRYKVPAYRRFGAGRLLGSNAFFRIDRSGNRDEFFLRGSGGGVSELSRDRKSALARAGRKSSDLVRVRVDKSQTFTGNEDFLPLKRSGKRKRSHSPSDEPAAEGGPTYRSIHGMSNIHENSDSDEAYGSDSASEVDPTDATDSIKLKTIELTARVKDHPEDIDAWIQLVDHQDVLRDLSCQNGRSATQAEVKSYADIKQSMLEKALKYSETPERNAELRLRNMLEGSKIWDSKTAAKRWEELLVDHGADFEIWKAYMTFNQTNLSALRYERIKQLYVGKLRTLGEELAGQPLESRLALLCEQLVIVFSRVTHFIAEAGYTELATAAWQAILEIHFYRPASLANASPESALSSLQIFWEGEAPRIGDESAKGWAVSESAGGVDESPEPKTFGNGEIGEILNTRDPYKAWAALEEHKARDAKVPARTMDDGTDDDPFRVVMYPDIENLLFFVPTALLPLIQEQLIDAFLIFCKLPSVYGTSNAIDALHRDQILTNGDAFLTRGRSMKHQEPDIGDTKPLRLDLKYQSMVRSTEVMFPFQQYFRYMVSVHDTMPPGQYHLVSNTLRQLAFSSSCPQKYEFATYYLSFDSFNKEGSSKKVAKGLLKQEPSNVDLYIGLARSEFSKGSQDAGKNIIAAALGLTGLKPHDRVRLCTTWAWFELETLQLTQALLRLCQAFEDTSVDDLVSPARVLKTRQLLTGNREHLLSSGDADTAVVYAEAVVLLEYITRTSGKEPQSGTQGDIWAAMASVDSCSEDIVSRGLTKSSAHERLLQYGTQLLYYHASHGRAFFREHIEKCIRRFPKNTIFLSLYAWREERLSIEDRVRSILDKIVLTKKNDHVSSRIFAIHHEMETGNSHSTRAAFEHAVNSETCQHHIGVWISYIRYCHQKKELRSKAKGVFYRAIQSCPWSKEIFMEAFITLAKDLDTSELKSVYNTLCDKGLRVHIELDEFVENWKIYKQRAAKQ